MTEKILGKFGTNIPHYMQENSCNPLTNWINDVGSLLVIKLSFFTHQG